MSSIQIVIVEAVLAVLALGALAWTLRSRAAASLAKAEAELEAKKVREEAKLAAEAALR